MKPGRNDPCPCGSGKKYKRCCGATEKLTPNAAAVHYERAARACARGAIDEALKELRALLSISPDHAAGSHLAGVLSFEKGEIKAARDFMSKAVMLVPREAQWHSDLAHVLVSMGEHEPAMNHGRTAVTLDPGLADGHNNLGNALLALGRLEEAEMHYRAAMARKPVDPWFQLNLAVCLQRRDRRDEAEQFYRKVMELAPQDATAFANLGTLYLQARRPEEARALLERAVQLKPIDINVLSNLGIVFLELGKPIEAARLFERVLALNPKSQDVIANLLRALSTAEDFEKAQDVASSCLRDPAALADAIGSVITIFGRTAAVHYRDRAYRYLLEPGRIDSLRLETKKDILMNLNYSDIIPAETVVAYHMAWGKEASAACRPTLAARPLHVGGRRLRIGYVSPDFREHSVAYFIKNVIAHHDRDRFEVYGYFTSRKHDRVTETISSHCHRFRDVSPMTDMEFVDLIRSDGIDILVDLAGHTSHNRLAVFARRSAPVQIAYLGYPNTTGLETMDFRIGDPHADCDDGTRYTERLLRLPECFLCFGSFPSTPKGGLPAAHNGFVTFGSFNALPKINSTVIRAWARVLARVPDSRLMIKAAGAEHAITRANLEFLFGEHDIGPERLVLKGWTENLVDHLREYDQVDIALDTFPYGGTTTTCQALWMGVPVVTTVGKVHAHRVGYSILANAGFAELAARDEDEFVDVAVRLASDRDRLATMRHDIPERLKASILCQPERFTRQVEQAYLYAIERAFGTISTN